MNKFIFVLLLGIIFVQAQHIHIKVDSTTSYTLWTQMHESIIYDKIVDAIQIVNRGYVVFGDLDVIQLPGDLTTLCHDGNVYCQQLGPARYPSSVASSKPYISFPFLISASWGGMGAQWESGGWFSSYWEQPVDIGPGDVDVHKCIGKQLPTGSILFIGVTLSDSIIYCTWDSTLTNLLGAGIVADSSRYWGFDVNGGIASVFYYSNTNDTLLYCKTTTDGINWSAEQQWHLSFTPPYPNTKIWWRQMALTDNGEPRLVFDAVNNDDSEYPYYGRIYVSHTSGIPPVQVSSSFAAPDTECFYPTIATGGNYCAVLYCMPRNNLPGVQNWWDFYLVWSDDNGLTWGSPINCTQGVNYNPGLPQLAKRIDTVRNRVYYCYCTHIANHDDPLASILSNISQISRIYLGCSPHVGIEETANLNPAFQIPHLEVYPNPFNRKTEIRIRIQDTGYMIQDSRFKIQDTGYKMQDINLKIYDASGRIVKSFNLESCIMYHESAISWDGTDDSGRKLPSGVYFVRLETDGFKRTEKTILLRW